MLQRATTDDIPVIRDLAHAIWWAHYPSIIPEAQIEYMLNLMYSPEALHRQMTEEGIQFWLVQEIGNTVGFIAVGHPTEGAYFLHKFYLQPSGQGKGLGAAAFHTLLEHYPDLSEIRLTVNRQNYKSINFYFKIGFRIEQCLEIPIGQGFAMNDFLMVWRR